MTEYPFLRLDIVGLVQDDMSTREIACGIRFQSQLRPLGMYDR